MRIPLQHINQVIYEPDQIKAELFKYVVPFAVPMGVRHDHDLVIPLSRLLDVCSQSRSHPFVIFDDDFRMIYDQPFTAPAVNAPTMNLCKTMNTTITGMIARTLAAAR